MFGPERYGEVKHFPSSLIPQFSPLHLLSLSFARGACKGLSGTLQPIMGNNHRPETLLGPESALSFKGHEAFKGSQETRNLDDSDVAFLIRSRGSILA